MEGTDECLLITDVEVSCWDNHLRQTVSQSISHTNQCSLQI